jgi:hypothetical protein
MAVSIIKGTRAKVKFKIYTGTLFNKTTTDLTHFTDFICSITDNGRLLLEKRLSKNGIKIENGKVVVIFEPSDTINLFVNPKYEEKWRTLELSGIHKNNSPERFVVTEFYLEGCGHYVSR